MQNFGLDKYLNFTQSSFKNPKPLEMLTNEIHKYWPQMSRKFWSSKSRILTRELQKIYMVKNFKTLNLKTFLVQILIQISRI